MAQVGRGCFLLSGLLWLSFGCGSTVTILDDDQVGATGGGAGAGGDAGCPELPEVELFMLGEGTFVDGDLHVRASVDAGPPQWVRLELDERGLFLRDAISFDGPAKLVDVDDGGWARLREDGRALERLGFLDGRPRVEVTLELDGTATEGTPLAFAEEHLFFCLEATPGAGPGLARLSLDGTVAGAQDHICRPDHTGWAAAGSAWAAYSGGSTTNGVSTKRLTANGAEGGFQFGYSPVGVHNYGLARAAFTDGQVAAFDTGSDDYFLLLGGPELSDFSPEGPYIRFGPSGPKRMLAVVAGVAYFATPSGFVMYDVGDIERAPAVLAQAPIALAVDEVRFVAASDDHVVFAAGEGHPLVLPSQPGDAPVSPAVVRRGSPDACP